jgi:hypothetical protein
VKKGNTMLLQIKNLKGDTFEVQAAITDTVDVLKQNLAKVIPVAK